MFIIIETDILNFKKKTKMKIQSKIPRKCDVIITYSWNRVGYNILRSLSQKKLKVVIGDTSKRNICTYSKFLFDSFVYPDPFLNEQKFINCLKEQIEYYNPRVLMPTHDEGIIIAKYRDSFPKELIIGVDDYSNLCLLSNKKKATNLANEVGVPVPKCFESTEEIKNFPVIVKTEIGNSSKTVFIVNTKTEIESTLCKLKGTHYLIQEFVGGIDYSVDCIRINGFFKAVTYKSILTKTKGGGTTTQRQIVSHPELEKYSQKILDHSDYSGVCGIDFRVDSMKDRVAFIEVNTRFTGGIATPILAGFDIPFIYYSLLTGCNYNSKLEIKENVTTKWILGDVITLISRLASLSLSWKELKQILNFKFDGFDDYFKNDKKIIIGEMTYYFIKLIKNMKLNP